MQKDLVELSLSNAFSIAKLNSISIKTKSNSSILIDLPMSQRKAMIHFYNGSSQNESSCASLLAACAKSQSEVQLHVKFIVELVSEGARNAPTIFQTFSSTVAFTSGAQSDNASPLTVFANQTNATTKNSPKKRAHGRHINSHRHRLFFERHRLIVVFIIANANIIFLSCDKGMIYLEGAQAAQTLFRNSPKARASTVNATLIVGYHYSKISLHFHRHSRIFCEGVMKQTNGNHIIDDIIGLFGQTGLVGLVGKIGTVGHIGIIGLIEPICFVDLNSLFIKINVDHDQFIVSTASELIVATASVNAKMTASQLIVTTASVNTNTKIL
jgi:hypothetical protein